MENDPSKSSAGDSPPASPSPSSGKGEKYQVQMSISVSPDVKEWLDNHREYNRSELAEQYYRHVMQIAPNLKDSFPDPKRGPKRRKFPST